MSALKKTAIGLSLIALTAFGAQAQKANDNRMAFNDTAKSITEKKDLTSPVIQKAKSTYDGLVSSDYENVSVVIHLGENDPISGQRYAKGFANGFASSEKTNGNPIYATANYVPATNERTGKTYTGKTYVEFCMDGKSWEFEGKDMFTPQLAGKLLPIFMADYVEKFGKDKILPNNTKPTLVTSLDR